MKENKYLIRISENDSVAVALKDLESGNTYLLDNMSITLKDDIPFGHKVALYDIKENENIIKYGQPIGHAKCEIKKGQHVHTHNLKTNLNGLLNYEYNKNNEILTEFANKKEAFFDGYKRANGKVGIRNEVWIIPTVGCVNTTAKLLERKGNEKYKELIDGVFAYTHNMGCSQLSEDHLTTQHILKGLINNPNAGAVLVLS